MRKSRGSGSRKAARSTARTRHAREAAKRNVTPFRWSRRNGLLGEKVSKVVGDRSRRADKRRRGGGGGEGKGRNECQGGFRKRGNSLEGFHAGTRPRATAQSIELSISRLGGSSDKVTHPLVPHLPFASRSSRPLFCFSYMCVCPPPSVLSTFRLRRFDLRLLERSWRWCFRVIANRTEPVDRQEPLPPDQRSLGRKFLQFIVEIRRLIGQFRAHA